MSGRVLLVSGHRDLVSLVVDVSLQLGNSSEVSLDRSLVSSSGLDQNMKSVLEGMSGVNASVSNVTPVVVSSLVVSNTGLQVVDANTDSVDSNSVSFERNSESSDVGLMLVELVLDGLARVFLSVAKFDFVLILGSQSLNNVSFSCDQSLVVGHLVDMNLNLSVMDSDLMAQVVNISSELVNHALVRAHFLVVVFTLQLAGHRGKSHSRDS